MCFWSHLIIYWSWYSLRLLIAALMKRLDAWKYVCKSLSYIHYRKVSTISRTSTPNLPKSNQNWRPSIVFFWWILIRPNSKAFLSSIPNMCNMCKLFSLVNTDVEICIPEYLVRSTTCTFFVANFCFIHRLISTDTDTSAFQNDLKRKCFGPRSEWSRN